MYVEFIRLLSFLLTSSQAEKNTLDLDVPQAELDERKKSWKPREPKVKSGTLWKYQQLVADASHGAITGKANFCASVTYMMLMLHLLQTVPRLEIDILIAYHSSSLLSASSRPSSSLFSVSPSFRL